MKSIKLSPKINRIFQKAFTLAATMRHEFVMPEHVLMKLLDYPPFQSALGNNGASIDEIHDKLSTYLNSIEKVPDDADYDIVVSEQFDAMMKFIVENVESSEAEIIDVPHIVNSMANLQESFAAFIIKEAVGGDIGGLLSDLLVACGSGSAAESATRMAGNQQDWRSFVVCLNVTFKSRNPLVGREKELDRTVQVLCRKDKNNPLHIGEPGVGKTALVYGLARMIEEKKVPKALLDTRIYSLDLGGLLAGTQFRGDFEKRLKAVLNGVSAEKNAILYIDEIHNLVGAGAVGEGSMDASNLLKPYLESGEIRFIGSTTYDEYKRHFEKSKGLVRRFNRIDIEQPTIDETIHIIECIKDIYEDFHGVKYLPEAIEFAVKGSARYITDRFLPDKAIDLIDEAGAYRRTHPARGRNARHINKALIAEILSKVSKIDSVAMDKNSSDSLMTLEDRIKARIFGQPDAVRSVVEAVQMSKAGLSDEEKPVASLLFVGPTGTGKTELAKSLAEELGIGFLRFDMSEYAEKHAVAKFIGSPAGYVGYDDGGILTDAVRKTPDCVLLLDEMEKAHPDIYNILLQVMDYGRLTDNKGNHADFRNVVLIMTSNAGARYAAQSRLGFASNATPGGAMLAQVKKTFQPEFINRLSDTVVFNELDRDMASLILDKKLRILDDRLKAKNVVLHLTPKAREFILSEGFSQEYGARELDRVINSRLKPILMRRILFGDLSKGGTATITLSDLQ